MCVLNCIVHRRRSDWNSGGTYGGTYYKSCCRGKKHIFLHCNASNLVLKILQHDNIWGDNSPTPNSGGGDLYPRDLHPWYCSVLLPLWRNKRLIGNYLCNETKNEIMPSVSNQHFHLTLTLLQVKTY